MDDSSLTTTKFEHIYNTLFKKLYLSCFNLTNDKELSEDLVHETFLFLWHSRKKIDSINNIDNFLFGVLKNKVYEAYRKEKFNTVALDEKFDNYARDDFSESELLTQQQLTEMHRLIKQLPDKRKKVFIMNRFQNKSIEEIAAELGLSQQTVKNQVYISLQFLKNNLKKGALFIFIFTTNF